MRSVRIAFAPHFVASIISARLLTVHTSARDEFSKHTKTKGPREAGKHTDILARLAALLPERLAITPDEAAEVHAETPARVPEVLSRQRRRHANVGQADIGEELACRLQVLRVPKAEDEARRKVRLVVGVRRDDLVHEGEEANGLVVDLDIDVEEHVLVLGEHEERDRFAERRDLLVRSLVRQELVEGAVVLLGLDPPGSVRRAVEKGVWK